IGSAILPKSVTRPRLRASCPSRKSVNDAPRNAASAPSRQPVPPWTRQNTKIGIRKIRTTVRMLATLTMPTGGGAGDGTGTARGGTAPCSPPEPCTSFTVTGLRAGDQVGADGFHHLGGHQVARGKWPAGEQRRRPVHVRRLVRGAALVAAGARHLLDEYLDRLANPVGGALRHDLLGKAGELADPAGHLVLVDLDVVGISRGLGAVLVRVAEDADSVEPGLVQELLELRQVRLRLAGEADDEVGPHARVRRELPDPLDQLGEPRAVAEPAHPAQHRAAGVLERQVEVGDYAGGRGHHL